MEKAEPLQIAVTELEKRNLTLEPLQKKRPCTDWDLISPDFARATVNSRISLNYNIISIKKRREEKNEGSVSVLLK